MADSGNVKKVAEELASVSKAGDDSGQEDLELDASIPPISNNPYLKILHPHSGPPLAVLTGNYLKMSKEEFEVYKDAVAEAHQINKIRRHILWNQQDIAFTTKLLMDSEMYRVKIQKVLQELRELRENV